MAVTELRVSVQQINLSRVRLSLSPLHIEDVEKGIISYVPGDRRCYSKEALKKATNHLKMDDYKPITLDFEFSAGKRVSYHLLHLPAKLAWRKISYLIKRTSATAAPLIERVPFALSSKSKVIYPVAPAKDPKDHENPHVRKTLEEYYGKHKMFVMKTGCDLDKAFRAAYTSKSEVYSKESS